VFASRVDPLTLVNSSCLSLPYRTFIKAFGPQIILHASTLAIRTGEHVGLVGANGCGKSTLAGSFAGWRTPTMDDLRVGVGHIGIWPRSLSWNRTPVSGTPWLPAWQPGSSAGAL